MLAREYGLTQKTGVEIMMLEEDGPAQNGGLWIEDVIVDFAGKPVTSVDDLQRLLTQAAGRRARAGGRAPRG